MTPRAAIRESVEAANRVRCNRKDPTTGHRCDRDFGHGGLHGSCAGFTWDQFVGDSEARPGDRDYLADLESDE